jgi:membrane fusion protein, multidrug efflux system
MPTFNLGDSTHRPVERLATLVIVAAAILLALRVGVRVDLHPRTDDAEVFANYIGIAPQVEGPIVELHVQDNQFVKKGELLFVIDPRPYEYALDRAVAVRAALEGQISDESRRIAAQSSGVSVAQAGIHTAEADVNHWAAAVEQAHADIANAEQGVQRVNAEWTYANSNLHRIEPLLEKQFVTADQVDRARSSEAAQAQALKQAQSQLLAAQAELKSAEAQYLHAQA